MIRPGSGILFLFFAIVAAGHGQSGKHFSPADRLAAIKKDHADAMAAFQKARGLVAGFAGRGLALDLRAGPTRVIRFRHVQGESLDKAVDALLADGRTPKK